MILTGDCVEVMATLDADSVDAIVTDPPYGLEFMGKEWDRLGAVSGGAGFGQPGIGDRPTPWTSFNGSPNPSCLNCGGTQRGNDGQGVKRCHCDNPEFPNRRLEQSVRMQTWHTEWAREAFRVAKPGAHLLAFGGTRTFHRLASAIEDAGWEIRDCLVWAYASGFPKSLDVSKAIDKAAGAERELGGSTSTQCPSWDRGEECYGHPGTSFEGRHQRSTLPATDAAKRWSGWGTALKPAWEPIVMARKPLRGTVAQTVLAYGTGALNIDATRISASGRPLIESKSEPSLNAYGDGLNGSRNAGVTDAGRWPANVILTDPIFDGGVDGVVGGGEASRSPEPGSFKRVLSSKGYKGGGFGQRLSVDSDPIDQEKVGYGDTGTYSRFFLIPKAARSDREPVLRGQLDAKGDRPLGISQWEGQTNGSGERMGPSKARENLHPTVKPVELMRHLVRLVTPPGGTVLDCFLGSGSTAIAAELEGFKWIGIEKEAEYVAIAEARLNGTQRGLGL